MKRTHDDWGNRGLLLAVALSTALGACDAVEDDANEAGAGSYEDVEASLEDALDDLVEACGLPGAILAIRYPDNGIFETASGDAHLAGPVAATPAMPSKIGSITKTFTATVVLQLVDEGALGLDDDFTQHAPSEYADAVPASTEGAPITIRQLLNHTSGIPDYVHDQGFQEAYYGDLAATWDPPALLAYSGDALAFEPGTDWHYSNTNYILLGGIVEALTGNPLEREIETRLFDALGLEGSAFPTDSAALSADLIDGYADVDGDGVLEADEAVTEASPSAAWAAGAITATAGDLLIWSDALVNGDLLSASLQSERLISVETAIEGVRYGLGIAQTDGAAWGHQGGIDGFSAIVNHHELGFDVAVLINGNSPVPACQQSNVATEMYEDAAEILTAAFGSSGD